MTSLVDINKVKEALRIDYDDEDTFLQMCLDAAISHLKDAVDDYDKKVKDDDFVKKANIVLIFTVQKIFDQRSFNDGEKMSDKINFIVQSMIIQMR